MHRKAVVAVLAAAAALALGACGPTATKANSAPNNQPKAPVALTPADKIAAAYDATLKAGTAKFTAALSTKISGNQIDLTAAGMVQFNPPLGETTLTGKGTNVHIISVGGVVYVQNDNGKWTKVDPTQATSTGGNDQVDYLGFLKGITGEVASAGTTTIHGASATGYKVTADISKAIQNSPGGVNKLLEKIKSGGTSSFPIELWLDDSGRLVQLKFHYDANARGADIVSDDSVQYYEFGTPVNVTAPPVG
ncbi:LolA-like protein [Fodinicola feengrottensis]|uniref:LppX_LprAFG lipoprotein n=1 Tax=Fodinicola feengrottensis TaxID=435914 RepID=A0ABN2FZ24_9ACTN|nr:LppX_LprAFG lipoprotein [Fodinicola feengrottensis]